MAEPTARTKLTYEDLLQLPEDGKRHELIAGEHYVTPAPVPRHQRVLVELLYLIRDHLERNALGEVFPAPLDVLFSEHDVVEPDLIYVSRRRSSVVTEINLKGSPDLVVEILSPTTRQRDLGIKRRLYEDADVLEYWIVDPKADTIEVLRRDEGDRFGAGLELSRSAGNRLSTPLLPGLEMPLEKIFPRR